MTVDRYCPLEVGFSVGKVGHITVMSVGVGYISATTSVDSPHALAVGRADCREFEVITAYYLILADFGVAGVKIAYHYIVVERAGDGSYHVGAIGQAVPCLELDRYDIALVYTPTVGVIALADLDVSRRIEHIALHRLSVLVGLVGVPYP